jgi:predicted esterase
LAPTKGTYVYPAGPADLNGADIFRAAVGLTRSDTWWRVDWNTLADRRIPIAEWALDTDDKPATGVSAWPAGAGVRSAGLDRAIVVSGEGAWLIDTITGQRRAVADLGGALTVDTASRSFVVRIPRAVLPPAATWRVRLGAGLADGSGQNFAPVGTTNGALPGQPALFNVTFRSYRQEPPRFGSDTGPNPLGLSAVAGTEGGSYWMEGAQADALTSGDVSPFSLDVRWADLAGQRQTPEPRPVGYSARWYVSSIDLGQGVVRDSGGNPAGDLRPNYLGRVQPYAVYVPTSYDPRHPAPLTWLLHSLGVNLNQYGALSPRLIQQACENRHSICATTEGRGPDGWYFDEAELDFWEVWNRLARAYNLDADRTVISGYSMGGYATYKLGLSYPDLFAKAVALAGPPMCGLRIVPGVQFAAGAGRCTTDGDTSRLVSNARWLPFVMADGAADELVPVSSVLDQINHFDSLGERYRFELYPAEDHLVFATQDGFSSAAAHMGDGVRQRDPGHVSFSWYPHLVRPDLGIGPTSAYWVEGLAARAAAPGTLASVDADSHARPDPLAAIERTHGVLVPGDPGPAAVSELEWHLGAAPPPRAQLDLTLTDVGALTLDLQDAGFAPRREGAVAIATDGSADLSLAQLAPGTLVRLDGRTVASAARDGVAQVLVAAGRHAVDFG